MESPEFLGAQFWRLKEEEMRIYSAMAYDDQEGLS